jgi:hypothetical protein
MNPFHYIEHASAGLMQHPTLALLIAAIAGLLSTTT